MERNKELIKDMINSFNKLSFFEEEYYKLGANRIEIRKIILKKLKEFKIELDELNRIVDEKIAFWSYHPVGDRKCIHISDNDLFLKTLLGLANKEEKKYDIKRIEVLELIPDEDKCYIVRIRWVDILSDKDTLKLFEDEKPIYHTDLIKKLNKLTKEGHSFVMLSNLVKEYDDTYLKEKIATTLNNDIIISVTNNDTLDTCINKLVIYMTRFGSDFSNYNIDNLVNNVNRIHPNIKKRKLNDYKYIKYDKK